MPFPSPMHACMLSRFSHVQLCVTLWTAAHQVPLSRGFSRQEYWSGLQIPSPSIVFGQYSDQIRSDQIRSVAQSCPTLFDPLNRSMPGLPVHHQFPEFTQTQVHRVSDAIQPSHPLSSPSPPAPKPSQRSILISLNFV